MMDRKDHVINLLTQICNDLLAKLANLYADSQVKIEELSQEIAKLKDGDQNG